MFSTHDEPTVFPHLPPISWLRLRRHNRPDHQHLCQAPGSRPTSWEDALGLFPELSINRRKLASPGKATSPTSGAAKGRRPNNSQQESPQVPLPRDPVDGPDLSSLCMWSGHPPRLHFTGLCRHSQVTWPAQLSRASKLGKKSPRAGPGSVSTFSDDLCPSLWNLQKPLDFQLSPGPSFTPALRGGALSPACSFKQ